MAKVSRTRGSASNIFDVFIQDSSSTTGAGLGSVTSGSSGLTILSKRELDADWTSLTPQTITTIGTFAAPSAASIRIKASGASAPTGSYQLMVLDALLGTGDASRWAQISIAGVTNMAPLILEIDLDPQVDVKFWNGTVVASPATAGIPEVNVKNINNVSTSAVTTVNANQGTTGVVTFTVSAQVDCNVKDWAGTAVSAPATAGIPEVNIKNVNNVSASSVTAVNANQGTTQPINFTGTAGSALAKSDMVDVAGAAVSTSSAQIGVNAVNVGGTAQTGRDIGASVLLSSGTGTGQLDFTSGVVKANVAQILGTALTETAGQIAAAFKKFFNIGTPAATMDHLVLLDTVTTYTGNTPQTGDSYARLGAPAGASIAADIAEVEAETDDIAAVKAKTDNLPASPAAVGSAMALTSGERNSVADALLARNIKGGSSTGRIVSDAFGVLRNKVVIAAGTLTVYDTDDTTVLWTATVTTTAGDPLSAIDPT